MTAPNAARLRQIAKLRGVSYRAVPSRDPLAVKTKMSRVFPVSQKKAFWAFTDPMSHVPLFAIIMGSTPAIRRGIDLILPENQFFAFEHVQEGSLPPRIMLVKYTLEEPIRITKEAVTDPFSEGDIVILDRKKGKVVFTFEGVTRNTTRITAESTFQATTGAVFARPFIDLVWLNFFERMMVADGELPDDQMLTKEFFRE